MGNTQAGPKSRDELAGKTIDTQNMIDEIFKFMFTKLKIPDFTNLSDPEKCKKYILFKANALNHYFNQVQIVPVKNSAGVIAFRKLSEIKTEDNHDYKKQSLCLMIAYYYTRIFQIYGALALTLLDDKDGFSETQKYTQRTAPGFNMSGGNVDPDELGPFGFLHTYLDYNKQYSYKVNYTDPQYSIYFEINKSDERYWERERYYDRYGQRPDSIKSGIFKIFVSKQLISEFTFKHINATRYEFGNVVIHTNYDKKSKKGNITKQFEQFFKIRSILVNRDNVTYHKIDTTTDTTVPVNTFFDDLFTKITPKIMLLYQENEDIVLVDNLQKGFDIKNIRDNIKPGKNRPRGHCIARAFQLLNTTGNLLPSNNMTRICARFENGVPKRDEKLSSSPGLHALANLFYDTIQNQKLKIGVEPENGTITLDRYIDFMKKMAQQYNFDEYKDGMKDINTLRYTRDSKYCGKQTGEMIIDQNVAISVNENVKELFNIQYKHAIECGKIFNMLFKIKRDTSNRIINISLSDKIYSIGFPEIQNINNHARTVLVNYYTSCENEYIKGSKKIFDSKLKMS